MTFLVHAERASEAKTEPVDCFPIVLGTTAVAGPAATVSAEVLSEEVDVPVPDSRVKVAVRLEGIGVAVVV